MDGHIFSFYSFKTAFGEKQVENNACIVKNRVSYIQGLLLENLCAKIKMHIVHTPLSLEISTVFCMRMTISTKHRQNSKRKQMAIQASSTEKKGWKKGGCVPCTQGLA